MRPEAASVGALRAFLQEIYLQDLVLALYGVYAARLADPEGRRLVQVYLRSEEDRRGRVERRLAASGVVPAAPLRHFFTAVGKLYGRITSCLGTRVMLRIVLSASRRASRSACVSLSAAADPDLRLLATLRARNEGDLLGALRQHLIDTRAPRMRSPRDQ